MTASVEPTSTAEFWHSLEKAVDPASYKPERNTAVEVARLSNREEAYYVLKQQQHRRYVRLSEEDYALWWQMNGRNRVKDLLFYSLKRYKSLPVGHLTKVIDELLQGGFLKDQSTHIYKQIRTQLADRAPESRGRRLLNAFMHTEIAWHGLDPFFTSLYKWTRPLYFRLVQLLLLMLVLSGGILFIILYDDKVFTLSHQGIIGVITLIIANLVVIGIHELAHALATKHVGREVNRGGFLLYFGLPAFFVDTRDTWMSSNRERIIVSWAGPYSGLIIGGLLGWLLTAVAVTLSDSTNSLWATFFYQIAFLAYFSVIINLNPLLELDGYFILMDWLEMPGLRQRAFRFWREEMWERVKTSKGLRHLWQGFETRERIFAFFGALAFLYSLFALWIALDFWQSRLAPFAVGMWQRGLWGRVVLVVLTALLVIPVTYYLFLFLWHRVQMVLDWLAHRDLLARPDLLALLIGVPILAGVPFIWLLLGQFPEPQNQLFQILAVWLLFITAAGGLVSLVQQLSGSRFQWAILALAAVPVALSMAWLTNGQSPWYELGLMAATAGFLASSIVAWFTINANWLTNPDRLLMLALILAGGLTFLAQTQINPGLMDNGRWLTAAFIISTTYFGLALYTPLLLNFSRSRFALPWAVFAFMIGVTPWLLLFPALQIPILMMWLFAVMLYLLLGMLTQFKRYETETSQAAVYSERERLVTGFNHFMAALFASYETVFGGRRLGAIQAELQSQGALDLDLSILQIAERARHVLLLAVDRLDDLAGTPFTQKAGQAAYDSLPWLEAETLSRHVLSNTQWGAQLAQGFIRARDRRTQLLKQADIFAGLDQEGVEAITAVLQKRTVHKGTTICRAGQEATHFYLIDSGQVIALHKAEPVATLTSGGFFGTNTLAGSGDYNFSYQASTAVTLYTLQRADFDPLLRADTTLSQQVSTGIKERDILKRMALFSSLSPQELATLDAQLVKKQVTAGEIVVRQGEPRTHLFIIEQGVVDVFKSENGRDKLMGKLGPGEHFGEYALFTDTPYQATLKAAIDTTLLLIDEPNFDRLVANCERMTHYVEQIGSGRLIASQRQSALPS